MRLSDLNPVFLHHGGEGVTGPGGVPVPLQEGVGLSFDCPCGACGIRCAVIFSNPIGGGPSIVQGRTPTWERVGETFDALTLTPSILRTLPRGCGWHGFITNGEVLTC